MAIFNRDRGTQTPRQRKLYAIYELAYTLIDASAAILFFIGSVMFFYKSLENPAVWCFVVGSAFFAFKPVLRVIREIHLAVDGDYEGLSERLGS